MMRVKFLDSSQKLLFEVAAVELQYEVAAVAVTKQKLPTTKKFNFSRAYIISTRTLVFLTHIPCTIKNTPA